MTKTTDASVVGISETRIDSYISSSEIEMEGYDILSLDRYQRGVGVACYVKKILEYNFCENTESIFIDIFIPITKPILVGIFYRTQHLQDVTF